MKGQLIPEEYIYGVYAHKGLHYHFDSRPVVKALVAVTMTTRFTPIKGCTTIFIRFLRAGPYIRRGFARHPGLYHGEEMVTSSASDHHETMDGWVLHRALART